VPTVLSGNEVADEKNREWTCQDEKDGLDFGRHWKVEHGVGSDHRSDECASRDDGEQGLQSSQSQGIYLFRRGPVVVRGG
jgi:hypothetical protein